MTDRKLLELAAKAYWGQEIDDVCSIRWLDQDECIGYTHGDNQDHNGCDCEFVWSPFTDDSDALRLAVKLKMEIVQFSTTVRASSDGYDGCHESTKTDPYAATRRAIVRAAAEIGAKE